MRHCIEYILLKDPQEHSQQPYSILCSNTTHTHLSLPQSSAPTLWQRWPPATSGEQSQGTYGAISTPADERGTPKSSPLRTWTKWDTTRAPIVARLSSGAAWHHPSFLLKRNGSCCSALGDATNGAPRPWPSAPLLAPSGERRRGVTGRLRKNINICKYILGMDSEIILISASLLGQGFKRWKFPVSNNQKPMEQLKAIRVNVMI